MNSWTLRKSLLLLLGMAVLAGVGLLRSRVTPAQDDNKDEDSGKTFTLDVLEDCNTLAVNAANPPEAATDVFPGDTLVVSGTIFPGGTFLPGDQHNRPTDPGAIGKWLSRAVMLVNTQQFNGGVSPIAFATMLYSFPDDKQSLLTEGLVPNVGGANERPVIGGSGRFRSARGQAHMENIGTNDTGCFNYRFTFALKKH